MRLKKLFLGLVFCALYILFVSVTFAQETLTITTYYPSPSGVYQNLQVHQDLEMYDGTNDIGDIKGIDDLSVASIPDYGGYRSVHGSPSGGSEDAIVFNDDVAIGTGTAHELYVYGDVYASNLHGVYRDACTKRTYTATSGTTSCPTNRYITSTLGSAVTPLQSGVILCCYVNN